MKERITQEAAIWHQALQADDADWDGFTVWLEADPAHREAYDAVALIDDTLSRQRDRLAEILPPIEQEQEAQPPRRRWMAWAGGAIAAAFALFVAIPMIYPGGPASVDYHTATGRTREIALADGSRIILGPSSHLVVSGEQQEKMQLEGGAWFDIRHDPARRLVITAAGQRISDIGTKFDLLALPGHVRIAVAEGKVSVASAESPAKAVELAAGRSMTINTQTSVARMADTSITDMGRWRSGQLVYNNASLSLVAADISRYVGHEVTVSPELADRRFSGVLKAGDGAELVGELGDLMDIEAKQEGSGFRLVAGGR